MEHTKKLYTILAIDDEPSILKAISRGLIRECNVISKTSVRSALDFLNSTQMDIDGILIDFSMPDISGTEGVKLIRRSEQYSDTPIIMLTGSLSPDLERNAFYAGVSDFVSKPFTTEILTARLQVHCDKHRMQQKLRALAFTDPLTGLENRRRLTEHCKHEIDRCRRAGNDFSVAFVDLDHFKKINDTYGHDAGDEVLVYFATLLKRYFQRPTDRIIRFGGEEFLLLISETEGNAAELRLEECLNELRTVGVNIRQNPDRIKVTASVGGVILPADFKQRDPKWIFDGTDELLYTAKRTRDTQIWVCLQEPKKLATNTEVSYPSFGSIM